MFISLYVLDTYSLIYLPIHLSIYLPTYLISLALFVVVRFYPDESYCKILPNCAIKNLEPKVLINIVVPSNTWMYIIHYTPLYSKTFDNMSRYADQMYVLSKRRGVVSSYPHACPLMSSKSIRRH